MKRCDGYPLKNFDPMYTVACYIMDKRYDAMNTITLDIPLDPIKEYMADAKRRGHLVSHMGVILAAYTRTVAEFPGLNRFIMNSRPYGRKEITVGMVVLKEGKVDSHGSMAKFVLQKTDTVFEVQKKIDAYVAENRENQENNQTEKAVRFFLKFPALIGFFVKILKWMDRHNCMPRKVVELSPFHASLVVTNLASIRTNHIFHHVYEFGTTGVSIAMGNARLVPKVQHGQMVLEKCMPLGVVMDERIASGAYFSQAFRKLKTYLTHPELLELPPETVVEDT